MQVKAHFHGVGFHTPRFLTLELETFQVVDRAALGKRQKMRFTSGNNSAFIS